VNAYDFLRDSFTKTSYLQSLKNTVKNMAVFLQPGNQTLHYYYTSRSKKIIISGYRYLSPVSYILKWIRKLMHPVTQARNSFIVTAIGIIHSPYLSRDDAPRQGRFSDALVTLEILPEFAEGLQDVEQEPHHIVLYWLDRSDRNKLKAIPPHTGIEHGVFATRSPDRPNPIGICIVEFVRREGNLLFVRGLDAIDGTPLLDIKPYSADLDRVQQ
jgi:formylmethanofuran dehydrogenase subunit E